MDSQTPTTFAKTELERALSEQAFGISSYEVVSCTELEASAVVTLLEGKTVSISLTPRGYTVCCSSVFDDGFSYSFVLSAH